MAFARLRLFRRTSPYLCGRSSATVCLAPLLFVVGCLARDQRLKLLEHIRPAKLGTSKCLLAPGLRDVEARVLEKEARAVAIGFEPKANPRIGEPTGRP